MYVIESNGETWSANVGGAIGKDHPARTAAPGDSYEFVAPDTKSLQKQRYVGMFDLVAHVTAPAVSGHGDRITLLAEHTPAA